MLSILRQFRCYQHAAKKTKFKLQAVVVAVDKIADRVLSV